MTAFLLAVIGSLAARDITAATLTSLSWENLGEDRTAIVLSISGELAEEELRHYPLLDPAREVIVLSDTGTSISEGELVVSNRIIAKFRLVRHPERRPAELRVVIDLADPDARIVELSRSDGRIRVTLGSTGSFAPTPTSTSAPTATSTPTATIPPPTPTATLTPTPTPIVEPSETPTATPTSPAQRTAATTTSTATPPISSSAAVAPPATDAPRPSESTGIAAPEPTPKVDPALATRIVEVAASPRVDGSSLVRITADGVLPTGAARYLEVDSEPPRVIVTIRGVAAPDLPRTVTLGDAIATSARLIHDPEIGVGELHLVLQLSGDGAAVAEMKQIGPHLVLRLAPRTARTSQ